MLTESTIPGLGIGAEPASLRDVAPAGGCSLAQKAALQDAAQVGRERLQVHDLVARQPAGTRLVVELVGNQFHLQAAFRSGAPNSRDSRRQNPRSFCAAGWVGFASAWSWPSATAVA